ncbi:glycoside hydrolase [Cladorrhinum sp. PSN259]|nr:glycoside hydrolase [Cladorrhinum sp. PSN259]
MLTMAIMAALSNLITLLGVLLFPLLSSAQAPPPTLPALPLHASSRWILDANNNRVKLRCINWAGHMETNIPEGLSHQPVDTIVDWIASQGFNCVRLTYSTDMALTGNTTTVQSSFQHASTSWSRPALYSLYSDGIQAKNPWITTQTTTLSVFATVIDKLYSRNVLTILDNHVSRASWCCNITDGNGWWDSAQGYNDLNSRFFDTSLWLSGLSSMANFSLNHPGVVAMSLRNELRAFPLLQDLDNRRDWYTFISRGASTVYAQNPALLIIIGGSQSSTDLTHLRTRPLDTSGWSRDKTVFEMHAYSFTLTFPDPFRSCPLVKASYGLFSGFVLEQNKPYTGPLILSEFGVGMSGGEAKYDGLNEKDDRYLNCLVEYMENNDADWAVWALQGSYYMRDGQVDHDEGWGLLNHDWSGWRNDKFPARLKRMWNVTQGP